MRSTARGLCVAITTALACALVPATDASDVLYRGRIVFGGSASGSLQTGIYTVNADGSDPRQLTKNGADHSPSWSPDGRWIAYVDGAIGRNGALMRMTSRGTQREIVFREPATATAPLDDATWSPKGQTIAFTSARLTTPQVWTITLGGTPVPVTREFGVHASWSPNGKWLAYAGRAGIFIVRPSGRSRRQVAGTSWRDGMPVWSPDGKWIALRTIRADGTSLLDVISIGGRRRRILARGAIVVPEAWSPTGDAVLFMRSSSSSLDATRRLYIVRLDGARARPVAYTDGATIGASWHR